MERLFDDWDDVTPLNFWPAVKRHWAPAIDVYEKDNNIVVELQIPKSEADKVNISVEDGVLRIEGGSEQEEEKEGKNYYRKEIRRGHFSRAISLPAGIKETEVKATHEDGVLKIVVPKAEVKEPKKIDVEVK